MPLVCGFESLRPHFLKKGYPSGQRGKTVNLLRYASQVRILPPGCFVMKPPGSIFGAGPLCCSLLLESFEFDSGSE